MQSPLLFLVFNRPSTTRRVFEALRAAKPPRLYVAADGPRANRETEIDLCREVREIATAVDWPCEVQTLFRDGNLGCKRGVSSGIGWFFENESEGVILEDDVLPLPSFFDYCDQLLARYRHDDRVAMVSGCNLVANRYTPAASYFLSRYTHIWGWASWRRAWRHYDVAMTQWPEWRDSGALGKMPGASRAFQAYWRTVFDAVHDGHVDTWDYQWTFACWRQGALAILPHFNQTRNLGFGADATHTTASAPAFVVESAARPLTFPLRHPDEVIHDLRADALIDAVAYSITSWNAFKRWALSYNLLRKFINAAKGSFSHAVP